MPLYEYRCKRCDAVFEKLILDLNWERDLKCPQCGSKELNKELSSFSSSVKSSESSASCCGKSTKFT